jgi:hypothetical protein
MLTQETVKKVLEYDPETGEFKRIWSPTAARIGLPVGWVSVQGYHVIKVLNRDYPAHRLAWLYMTGAMPASKMEIDHVNGIRNDNRFCNLRLASKFQNQRNRKLNCNNSSGIKGVCWNAKGGKWDTYIHKDKKLYSAGFFIDLSDAEKAINKLRAELHGEFANYG